MRNKVSNIWKKRGGIMIKSSNKRKKRVSNMRRRGSNMKKRG